MDVEEEISAKDLPLEVLALVFSFLNDDVGNDALVCMEVCKPWRALLLQTITKLCVAEGSPSALSALSKFQCLRDVSLNDVNYRDHEPPGSFSDVCLQTLGHCTNLEKLHISYTHGQGTLTAGDVAAVLKRFSHLRVLDLSSSFRSGAHFPDLSLVANLEILSLSGGTLGSFPSLDPLTALQSLCLESVRKINTLPPLTRLTNLRQISLTDCLDVESLPPIGPLPFLEDVCLNGTSVEAVAFVGALPRLRRLSLELCGTVAVVSGLDTLSALTQLGLIHSIPREDLMAAPFPSLKKLSIGCSSLHMPAEVDVLSRLQSITDLSLSLNYAQDRELPLQHLTGLESLTLEAGFCGELAVLAICHLSTLTRLQVTRCFWPAQLDIPSCLPHLQVLALHDIRGLELFPSVTRLTKLRDLYLHRLSETKLSWLTTLTSLTSLTLKDQVIESFPVLNALPLQELRLDVIRVPLGVDFHVVGISSTSAPLTKGDHLSGYPPDWEDGSCPSLPVHLSKLPRSLEKLEIGSFGKLQSISFAGATSLVQIQLSDMPLLRHLDDLDQLCHLKELFIYDCDQDYLPDCHFHRPPYGPIPLPTRCPS